MDVSQDEQTTDPIDSSSILNLLPTHLLDVSSFLESPRQQTQTVDYDSPLNWDPSFEEMAHQGGGSNETTVDPAGLKLTTTSGLSIVIQDPYVAEQLLLSPLRQSLLASYRRWSRSREDVACCEEFIKCRNMLSDAFDEYSVVFGCLPGQWINCFMDYALEELGTEEGCVGTGLHDALLEAQKRLKDDEGVDDTSKWPNNDIQEAEGVDIRGGVIQSLNQLKSGATNVPRADGKATNPMSVHRSDKRASISDAEFNIRYKTQLCRHFNQSGGYCSTGVDCHFAHGPSELRSPKCHPKYRTRICQNFAEYGQCSYGTGCYFQHVVPQTPVEGMRNESQSRDGSPGSVDGENASFESLNNTARQTVNQGDVSTPKGISPRIFRDITNLPEFNSNR